jgi:hypothetical protein
MPEIRDIVSRQVEDVHDLIDLLEIDLEDILDRFPDHILDHKSKFGITDVPFDD